MTETERPLRADARRNRERIMAAAGELFAQRGRAVQMEEIASRCGLGMGTLYRHFPNKEALLTAMVGERYKGMTALAEAADEVEDPSEAFDALLRSYLEAADGDASFQLALMGPSEVQWEGLRDDKARFVEIATGIIERAVAAERVRPDFTFADFPMLTSGVISTMYFKPAGNDDWRRHLEFLLDGIRVADP